MLIALTVSLLLLLTVLRYFLEPSCPGCAAKRWSDDPVRLACAECGWSSASDPGAAAEMAAATYGGAQYEISFR